MHIINKISQFYKCNFLFQSKLDARDFYVQI